MATRTTDSAQRAPRISDDDLLADLRACAKRLGRSPTTTEYRSDEHTLYGVATFTLHFDSWNEAKRRAGLGARRFVSDKRMLDDLKELGKDLGRRPKLTDVREQAQAKLMLHPSAYTLRFGSFSKALIKAGYTDVTVRAPSKSKGKPVPAAKREAQRLTSDQQDARLAQAAREGKTLAQRLGKLPTSTAWTQAHARGEITFSYIQVHHMLKQQSGSWAKFKSMIEQA